MKRPHTILIIPYYVFTNSTINVYVSCAITIIL